MDNEIKNFYDLTTGKESHNLVLEIYRITSIFPLEEKHGIVNQIRRAAASITANIAEGFSRFHFKDKLLITCYRLQLVTILRKYYYITYY